MAKSQERFIARKMRRNGKSLNEIAKSVHVSKGSVSIWCSDIILTKKQKEKLHEKMIRGSYAGRMKGAKMQKDKKMQRVLFHKECGVKDIPTLTERELFILGLGLYWGEGSKKYSVRFYNSDIRSIKVMMRWFREVLHVDDEQFMMYININHVHAKRIDDIISYWSRATNVPREKFRKPTLIKVQNKKIYENFSEHYGTLSIRIAKSTDLLYQILGWIDAASKLKK